MSGWVAGAVVVAGVGGAIVASEAADDAADEQASSIAKAATISGDAARLAREQVIQYYGDSQTILNDAIHGSIDSIASGEGSTMDIIGAHSDAARDIIQQGTTTAIGAMTGAETAPGTILYDNTRTGQTAQSGRALAAGETPAPTGDAVEDAIRQQYAQQFGREPDQAGLSYWKDQAAVGNLTSENIAQTIANAGAEYTRAPESTMGVGPAVAAAQNVPVLDSTEALGIMNQGTNSAVSRLTPYEQSGAAALGQQSALTGAFGNEAQQQAIDSFIESPGQQYLREQQEQALIRNQAAIGGLGGGRVRTALQEQAYGIAAQQQQQQVDNLSQLSGLGIQASGAQAGFLQQSGLAGSAIASDFEQAQAAMQQQANLYEAQLRAQAGVGVAGMTEASGQNLAGLQTSTGANLANVSQQSALNVANLQSNLGQAKSNVLTGEGTALANIATGAGTDQANFAQGVGNAQAAGVLGQNAAFQQGLSGVATALGQIPTASQSAATYTPQITSTSTYV